MVSRHDVEVEVEDRLPRGRAAAVEDVEALRVDRLAHLPGEAPGGERARGEVVVGDLEEVLRVRARDHQRVARIRRVDVHEGDRLLVFGRGSRRAIRPRRSCRRCSRGRSRSAHARGAYASVLRACVMTSSRPETSPANSAAWISAMRLPSSGPSANSRLARQLVARQRERGRARALPFEGVGQDLADELQVRFDHLGRSDGARAPRRHAVRRGEERHVRAPRRRTSAGSRRGGGAAAGARGP